MSQTKPASLPTTQNLLNSKSLRTVRAGQKCPVHMARHSAGFKSASTGHNYKKPGRMRHLLQSVRAFFIKIFSLVRLSVIFPDHRNLSTISQLISKSPNHQYCPQSQIRIFPSRKPAPRSSCESPFQLRQHRSHRSLPGYACSH